MNENKEGILSSATGILSKNILLIGAAVIVIALVLNAQATADLLLRTLLMGVFLLVLLPMVKRS